MDLLKVSDLTKTFGDGKTAVRVLKGISFQVPRGEFVAVMGQSGSGKSTLLYNVSGMDRMTSGEVRLGDVSLDALDEAALADLRLKTMGFVFQNNYLLKNLTVRDNIALPGFHAAKQSRKAVLEDAERLMRRMGIAEVADRPIQKISGGQLQRASICRALINGPEILFADEPTGALNSRASAEVASILNELNRDGMTLLMVTHDAKMAARTDRVIYLKDGRIADALTLGKFTDAKDWPRREAATLNWLIERGF